MICEVCNQEKPNADVLAQVYGFYKLCFNCYISIPYHIPKKQRRKFLIIRKEKYGNNT